jgi:hypothetical protein
LTNEQLNILAIQSKNGCLKSLWEIRGYFWQIVHKMSDDNWLRIDNQERFEHSSYKRIEEAIKNYDLKKGSFAWQVMFRLRNLLHQHVKRSKLRKNVTYLQDHQGYTDEGVKNEDYSLILQDTLASVDAEYLVNEKVALLAEGDPRKLAILKEWTDGGFNDSETAALLEQRFGGNSESHRKYVIRFRIKCQKTLADVI